MPGKDHISLRCFIERIIAEKDKRRDDLRTEDHRALKLQTQEFERRFETYPTLRDFNELKNRVDITVAMFQAITAVAVFIGIIVAILAYWKP